MILFISTIVACVILPFIVLFEEIYTAPSGNEDETGFHICM